MNSTRLLPILFPLLALSAIQATAATFNFPGIGLSVPDGNPAGAADVRNISSDIGTIEEVTVTLTLSGDFNGDLYVYLKKDSGFSVLLNRTGKNGAGSGYSDSGFNVTLSDSSLSDIHTYQNSTTPAPGSPLTGTWQPDGRTADPDNVLFTDARTAMLSSFDGLAASGEWTLFVADLNGGDAHTLQSWSLTITGQPVPEPGSASLLAAGMLLWGRRRRRTGR